MRQYLRSLYEVPIFDDPECTPLADVVVYLKFLPSLQELARVSERSHIFFMPVDVYGSYHEIHSSEDKFHYLSLVIVHSRRLERYFSAHCKVAYLDHPLKFILNEPRRTTDNGPLIWIGQQCNLRHFVQWLEVDQSDRDVWILANFGDEQEITNWRKAISRTAVRLEQWSLAKHVQYLETATAAVDIKGADFRSRNKPPAKSFDFAASGIPVIVGKGSSADYDFRHIQYTPLYEDSWQQNLDADYRHYVHEKSFLLRQTLSDNTVWNHLHKLLEEQICSSIDR